MVNRFVSHMKYLVPKGFLIRGVNLLVFYFPLKVWRGAFLLADYILFDQDTFRCCTLLELGGGTGLTSIIAATIAGRVYCTGAC